MNDIRSPSDTTIYAPALQKKLTPNGINTVAGFMLGNEIQPELVAESNKLMLEDRQNMSQNMSQNTTVPDNDVVTHFIETVRMDRHPDDTLRRSDVAGAELEEAHR